MATTQVGVRELKNHLSEYLESVEQGIPLTVTRRGKAVATLIPAKEKTGLEEMIADGRITWSGRKPRLPKPIKLRGGDKSASDYIIEERDRRR